MSLYCAVGSPDTELSGEQLFQLLSEAFTKLGPRHRVLVVPPDQSREHSRAGELTGYAYKFFGDRLKAILPAIGTHTPMRPDQIAHMFPGIPPELFHTHDWRTGIDTVGEVPAEFIRAQSEGKLDYPWPAQVSKLITQGHHDLILSIGQVVPHEVVGMANYTKNIVVGTGGREGINRSHYLGAVYGMERIMGRATTPVRNLYNYAQDNFLKDFPIVYVHTVVGRKADGGLAVRGLFVGDSREVFTQAAELSLKVNFEIVPRQLQKVVVYLEPEEFHSTWIGNKSIYRTRMALADGAELIILGPGVKEFGEDKGIDQLIRKYGYKGTETTLAAVKNNDDLSSNLSAAAHLIHGSSEGRFHITWCPAHLTREEVEGVGFAYGDCASLLAKYNPARLQHGFNHVDGEEIFFIANPGLGLWAHPSRL